MIGSKLQREAFRLETMADTIVSTEKSQASLPHSQRVLGKHVERIDEVKSFV